MIVRASDQFYEWAQKNHIPTNAESSVKLADFLLQRRVSGWRLDTYGMNLDSDYNNRYVHLIVTKKGNLVIMQNTSGYVPCVGVVIDNQPNHRSLSQFNIKAIIDSIVEYVKQSGISY